MNQGNKQTSTILTITEDTPYDPPPVDAPLAYAPSRVWAGVCADGAGSKREGEREKEKRESTSETTNNKNVTSAQRNAQISHDETIRHTI